MTQDLAVIHQVPKAKASQGKQTNEFFDRCQTFSCILSQFSLVIIKEFEIELFFNSSPRSPSDNETEDGFLKGRRKKSSLLQNTLHIITASLLSVTTLRIQGVFHTDL